MEMKKIVKMYRKTKLMVMFAIMLFATLAGAVQGAGFNLFGYHIGTDGVGKEENFRENFASETTQNQVENLVQVQEQHSYSHGSAYEQGENTGIVSQEVLERVDIQEAIDHANSDKYTQNAMKEFAGDHYCLMTEERIAYFGVGDDGSLEWLSEEPDDCYEVKSTEAYAMRLWEKVRNKEEVSYGEIKENVKIPFKLKTRLAWSGFKDKINPFG